MYKTVAICDDCWIKSRDTAPVRIKKREKETCHFCDKKTKSGIYVRVAVPNVS